MSLPAPGRSAGETQAPLALAQSRVATSQLAPASLWQSVMLQQFIETTGPARQGIVTFFTIFLLSVYSYPIPLSTAVFQFMRNTWHQILRRTATGVKIKIS
jgi:hypothetical protein